MTQTHPKPIADFKRHPVDLPDEFSADDAPTGGAVVWLFAALALMGFGIFVALTIAALSARGWLA